MDCIQVALQVVVQNTNFQSQGNECLTQLN